MTIGDAWPVPSIEENLEKLQGARYFSAIDASAAYHTVPVEAKSRPIPHFPNPVWHVPVQEDAIRGEERWGHVFKIGGVSHHEITKPSNFSIH